MREYYVFMDKALRMAARPLEVLVGAFFVLAAFLKLQDPQLFAVQIHEYQVLTNKDLLAPAALFFLTLELTLGTAMLVGLRLRTFTLVATMGMLVFFTGLIAYAWRVHGLEDCGCMGDVKMSPPISILKNAVLMLMTGWAWLGFVKGGNTRTVALTDKLVATAAVAIVTVAAVWPAVYRSDETKTPPAPTQNTSAPNTGAITPAVAEAADAGTSSQPRPFAGYSVKDAFGETYDLGSGRYLVAALSATCDHCMASVPKLNEYTLFYGELPPLVALCYEPSAGDLEDFKGQTFPEFPLLSLGDDFIRFSRYIGKEPPRLHLVENGQSLLFWDEENLPTAGELVEFLGDVSTLSPVDPGAVSP